MSQRHCEPTGRANARPMTGSAKQSISPSKERMDCFAWLAMTVFVVPAKAGTHNHRWSCGAKAVEQRLSTQTTRRMGPCLRRNDIDHAIPFTPANQPQVVVWCESRRTASLNTNDT